MKKDMIVEGRIVARDDAGNVTAQHSFRQILRINKGDQVEISFEQFGGSDDQ